MNRSSHLYRYCLDLKPPLNSKREGLLLKLDGGWGEIAPLPGFSSESLAQCEAELRRIWPEIQTAESKLSAVQWGLHCARKPWPPKPFQLPLSALLWDAPVPDGYRTLKLKLKNLSIEEAVRRVKAIQAQGSYEIRLDCNRSWSLEQALAFAKFFKPDDFAYLEEPIRSFEELKEFSLQTGFPLAIDESMNDSRWEQIPTVKAAIVKPTVLGKIPKLPPHIDLVLSGAYETGIGTLHIAALPSSRAVGLDTYRYLSKDILKSPLQIKGGFLIWNEPFEIDPGCLEEIPL